jgi:hypothetical protein
MLAVQGLLVKALLVVAALRQVLGEALKVLAAAVALVVLGLLVHLLKAEKAATVCVQPLLDSALSMLVAAVAVFIAVVLLLATAQRVEGMVVGISVQLQRQHPQYQIQVQEVEVAADHQALGLVVLVLLLCVGLQQQALRLPQQATLR